MLAGGRPPSGPADHSIRMERTSYKSQDLVYEEVGYKLVVYLEMSGVRRFDWLAVDTAFERWTEPAGETIPEAKQAVILRRFDEWARGQGLCIDVGPGMDRETFLAAQEKQGWRLERLPDGAVLAHPPPRPGPWARLVALTKIAMRR
jgi:hypothetical protein